jgi:DNA-binding transcriptional regulator YdaS (Cro superfamily)
MNEIARYLDETRTSQAAFAGLIGVTPGRVSHLVNGSTPSPELAVRIEVATGGDIAVEQILPDLNWNRDESGQVTGYTVPVQAA